MMNRKLLPILTGLLVIHVSISAQIFISKNYSTENGLSNPEVYHVIQDQKGYIWFGTSNGANRFDGYSFKHFTTENGLPDNTVFQLFEDNSSRIWFITFSGLLSYYQNDSIKLYPYNNQIQKAIANKTAIPKSFFVDQTNTVWFTFSNIGLRITSEGVVEQFISDSSNSFSTYIKFIDNTNTGFIYGNAKPDNESNKKIAVINPPSERSFSVEQEPYYSEESHFFPKDKQNIFFSNNEYLYQFKNDQMHFIKTFTTRIISLYQDKENSLWVGTYNDGVYFSNSIQNNNFVHLLEGISVSSIIQDNERNIWLTTLGNGVYFLPQKHITTLTTKDGLSDNKVNCLAFNNNGNFSIGYENGSITQFDAQLNMQHKIIDKNYPVSALLYTPQNELWIGALHLHHYNNNTLTTLRDVVSVKTLINSNFNNFWIGNYKGVFYFKDDILIDISGKHNLILRSNELLAEPDGSLWIGSLNGLWYYNTKGFIYYGDLFPEMKTRITALEKTQNGVLWVGTKGAGIYLFSDSTLVNYNTQNGLVDNFCTDISKDMDSSVWISTNSGIQHLYYQKEEPTIYKINSYNTNNGLISNEVNALKIIDDTVWLATNRGLVFFDKNKIHTNTTPPPVYITSLKVLDKDQILSAPINLKYNQNHIKIQFTGLCFQCQGNIRYRYQLHGIDLQWENTDNNIVSYPALPSGDYEFFVQAINNAGVKSSEMATLKFSISKPYWQTWWFINLVSLLVVLIAGRMIYLRIKRTQQKNNLLRDVLFYRQQALIAQMNPHFIFNCLNSIQHFILQNDIKASNKFLSNFAHLMRITMEHSQHGQITLANELDTVRTYLGLESFRFENKFDYTINLPDELNPELYTIPPFLIQPSVENAILHGLMHKKGKGELVISLSIKNSVLTVIVDDNGVGREKAMQIKSQKSNNYKSASGSILDKRMKLLSSLNHKHFHFILEDLKDNENNPLGTRVTIQIPVNITR